MRLTNLFTLATAALGAVVEYDDMDAQYVSAPAAIVYRSIEGGAPNQVITQLNNHCVPIQPPIAGHVRAIRVVGAHYCTLHRGSVCEGPGYPFDRETYIQGVWPAAVTTRSIKCN
ncbi:hypothetical protein X797_012163 [Metarhizium robertsii]|uniref:Uncharacterized protein n=1 Tax=Metarhizium robertsii TaxID=568076 RepID=A0A014P0N0_9HYPO|nr:hypothetical protein X797_012163 [Metarhizium robertsii]